MAREITDAVERFVASALPQRAAEAGELARFALLVLFSLLERLAREPLADPAEAPRVAEHAASMLASHLGL